MLVRRLSGLMLLLASTLLLATAGGCSSQSDLPVSGIVTLDGRPAAGEVLFEPISEDGKRSLGNPVTTFADDRGRFQLELPRPRGTSGPLLCRVVVRAAPRSESGLPGSLDLNAPPEKVVELRREIPSGGADYAFALTQ